MSLIQLLSRGRGRSELVTVKVTVGPLEPRVPRRLLKARREKIESDLSMRLIEYIQGPLEDSIDI
jgi:hypothetical protein